MIVLEIRTLKSNTMVTYFRAFHNPAAVREIRPRVLTQYYSETLRDTYDSAR